MCIVGLRGGEVLGEGVVGSVLAVVLSIFSEMDALQSLDPHRGGGGGRVCNSASSYDTLDNQCMCFLFDQLITCLVQSSSPPACN
jgi:hypothetical protein